MTQKGKIGKLLEKFGFTECRSATTPLVPGERLKSVKFNPELVPVSAAEHTQFMSVVGSIQYIVSVTRPDFAFAACGQNCKKKGHFQRNCPDLDPAVRKFLQEKGEQRKASGAQGRRQ